MDTRVHISIEVSNLEASIRFYSQLFQKEPTKVKSDYANFRLDAPTLHLALVHRPGRSPEPPLGESSRHFGIELFSDDRLSGWLGEAQKAELNPLIEERVTCCYAVADKFWVIDPDGHRWEFWVRKEEAAEMGEGQSEACCTQPSNQVAAEDKAEPGQAALSSKAACCALPVGATPLSEKTGAPAPCCGPVSVQLGTKPQ